MPKDKFIPHLSEALLRDGVIGEATPALLAHVAGMVQVH
jgi:hypothetical protein